MSASAQAITSPPPTPVPVPVPVPVPASSQSLLLPVPTQVKILAAFLAALGSGWVVLAVLFVYYLRRHGDEDDMALRIAHRLATKPKAQQQQKQHQPGDFIDDDIELGELAIFNRPKEPC